MLNPTTLLPVASNPPISQNRDLTILDLPSDILTLIGRCLFSQDAINYTSACVKLFNLRFADTGFGILCEQSWRRIPSPDEAISSIIAVPAWSQRAGGRLLRNDSPGITALTLDFCFSFNKITNQELDSVTSRIGKLNKIHTLFISCSNLEDKESYHLLRKIITIPLPLTNLGIELPYLLDLPDELGQLSNLQHFSISSTQLTYLPPELGQLSRLERLFIYLSQLTSLPAALGQLSNLQYLHIAADKLTAIPAELGQLGNLQYLTIVSDKLASLPTGLGRLSNLQRLTLYSKRLASLPAELGQLNNLQHLDITAHRLTSLPTELGQLRNLKDLSAVLGFPFFIPLEIELLKLNGVNVNIRSDNNPSLHRNLRLNIKTRN